MKTHMGSGLRPITIISSTSMRRSQLASFLKHRSPIRTKVPTISQPHSYHHHPETELSLELEAPKWPLTEDLDHPRRTSGVTHSKSACPKLPPTFGNHLCNSYFDVSRLTSVFRKIKFHFEISLNSKKVTY